jgi:hypothetical protein
VKTAQLDAMKGHSLISEDMQLLCILVGGSKVNGSNQESINSDGYQPLAVPLKHLVPVYTTLFPQGHVLLLAKHALCRGFAQW